MSRYGIVVFWPDKPDASQQILLHAMGAAVKFAVGLSDSRAVLETATTTASTYTVKLNGSTKATITYAAGTKVGAFTNASAWVAQPGDRLEIIAPTPADATAAGVAITLMGEIWQGAALTCLMTGTAALTSTLDHTYLYATLTASASLSSRLREANAFGPQLLAGNAGLLGTLSDCKTLKCNMRLGKAPEFFGRLTVVKDERLFR